MCMSVVCGAGCGEKEFRCTDGRCIGYELQCNGVEECSDGSDERDCGNYAIHTTSYSPPGHSPTRTRRQKTPSIPFQLCISVDNLRVATSGLINTIGVGLEIVRKYGTLGNSRGKAQ